MLAAVYLAAVLSTLPHVHDLKAVAENVQAERMRLDVTILASDAFEGRAPGTRGGRRAALHIERRLREAGIAPGAPSGAYRQAVPLHQSLPLSRTRLDLWILGQHRPLVLGDDYLLYSWGPSSVIPRRVRLVFVGHGIVAPEFDHNDYDGVDVRGAVVVYLSGLPPALSDSPASTYASPDAKRRIAQSRGAVAAILIPRARGETADAWGHLQRIFAIPKMQLPYGVPDFPSFILHPGRAHLIFSDALFDFEQVRDLERRGLLRPFFLPVTLSFQGHFSNRDFQTFNIVGLIPGSDPRLRREAIVVSAHYDHLGVIPEEIPDPIYNGAVDNALGVAGVLELARVLAELPIPPRRSVLIVLTTAEEEGLLGARHFLAHPPRPTVSMVANVNVDGLAFLDTFDDVIPIGAEYSNLDLWLEQAVRPLGLRIGAAPPQLWLQEGFYRSDQLAFAEAGIPAIMINEGFDWHHLSRSAAIASALDWMRNRYHTPIDDLDQYLDFHAAKLHLQAALALVLTLADADETPDWEPGNRYAYQRALARARQH